jgi:hypothetical protein
VKVAISSILHITLLVAPSGTSQRFSEESPLANDIGFMADNCANCPWSLQNHDGKPSNHLVILMANRRIIW